MKEFFEQIKLMIEKADSLNDMVKLNDDINEGEILKVRGNKRQKEAYVTRIRDTYFVYISAINMVNAKREEIMGANSDWRYVNIEQEIDNDITMLKLIGTGKLYEELLKMF